MGPYSRIVEISGYGIDGLALQATRAQTITIPFEFEPLPLSTPTTPPLLPDFGSVAFINQVGSSALTLFTILDALAFLGVLLIIYLAAKSLWWLYGIVTGRPENGVLNVSGGLDAYSTWENIPLKSEERYYRESADNPFLSDDDRGSYRELAASRRAQIRKNRAWSRFGRKIFKFK